MKENSSKNNGFTAVLAYCVTLASIYYSYKSSNFLFPLSTYFIIKIVAPIAALFIFIKQIGAPKVHPKKEDENKKNDWIWNLIIVFSLAIFLPVIWRELGTHGEITQNQQIVNEEAKTHSFAYNFIATCIIAPLGEEVIFRYLPGKFLNNEVVFMTVSSVVFAYIHCFSSESPLLHMPTYIGVSILLGYIYYKSERLLYSSFVHFAFNFVGGGYLSHFLSR